MKESNSLVIVQNNELYVGTWDLAQGFEVEHRALTRLLRKYHSEFESFLDKNIGEVTATRLRQPTSKKGGKPFEEFLINEGQAIYLTTLLTNNEMVRKFKMLLSKEFLRQRKLLNKLIVQKQNAEWLQKRAEGKIERRIGTNVIKLYIEYAKSQGSKNADKYYMQISKMENNALFYLEFLTCEYKNLRDVVNGFGLDALKMADHIVAKSLKEGMERSMYYKEIYQMAKARIESFVDLTGKLHVDQSSRAIETKNSKQRNLLKK